MSDLADRDEGITDPAAEYALGVLDGWDRRAVERRMRDDAGFAAEVEWWQTRLAPLLSDVPGARVSPEVWNRISADIDRIARVRSGSLPSGRAARPNAIARVSPIWRTLATASSLLAVASLAALAVLLPSQPFGTGAEETLVASLTSETGQTFFTIVLDPANETATLVPVQALNDPTRVPELWLIEDTQTAPRSLGVVDLGQPLRLRLDGVDPREQGAALAVSLEPQGGSPSGSPTGPVVATGALDRI